jgi:hypothetical protein
MGSIPYSMLGGMQIVTKDSKKCQKMVGGNLVPAGPTGLVRVPKHSVAKNNTKDNLSVRWTKRERVFIECYIRTGRVDLAAKEAGYKGKTQAEYMIVGTTLRGKLGLTFEKMREHHGLTEKLLIDKVIEGLNANVVKPVTYQGKLCSEPSYPDYSVRARYVELLKDLVRPDTTSDTNPTVDGVTYQIVNYGTLELPKAKAPVVNSVD